MKAIELDINEIGGIGKIIERVVKAKYMRKVEDELLESIEGEGALPFLAGFSIGHTIACVDMAEPSIAAVPSRRAYEIAAEIEVEGRGLADAFGEFREKLGEYLAEEEHECDCPKCRAEREAEGE